MAKTIMVVDDESDIRESLKTVLEKNGYKVITAVNGDDCLKKLPKQNVDLILLDIMMPGMPVREVVKMIKDTKIAYLSLVGLSKAEKKELLKSKNVVDFIEKPFDIKIKGKELLKRIKNIVD